MILDGLFDDPEAVRDLLVAETAHHQAGDLLFAGGKPESMQGPVEVQPM